MASAMQKKQAQAQSLADVFRDCRDLYEEGAPMYTKERIEDIQEQLRDDDRSVFTLTRIDGQAATQGFRPMPKALKLVDFFTYQELVQDTYTSRPFPYCTYAVMSLYRQKSRWDAPGGIPQPDDIARHEDEAESGGVAAVTAGLEDMSVEDRTHARWHSAFFGATREWEGTESCARLRGRLARAFELVPEQWAKVDKVVCFALGEPGNDTRQRMMQHAMITTIADMLEARFQTRVRKLTQDPGYSAVTVDGLRRHGFEVMEEPGGVAGYLEIDNNSVVASIYLPQPIKQMIADMARPMMIIVNSIIPDTPANKIIERQARKYSESPRTRDMWQDYYDEAVFVRNPNNNHMHWGDGIHVMWREVHPVDPAAAEDDDSSVAGSVKSYDKYLPAPPTPTWVSNN
ncbi:hypothetical protein F4775DRAFT_186940 [Biscogniauxia sp. FL1348]|nr:hypothetical protein F4775DRAFT_186940 [Biscogniauxia sp. FL1348]